MDEWDLEALELKAWMVILGTKIGENSKAHKLIGELGGYSFIHCDIFGCSVKANCRQVVAEIGSKFGFCSLNPASSIQLKSIGGRQTIESVPCDKNKTSTGQMLIKIVNHLNNEGYKNPYGHNSGLEGVHNGPMAYQASSGLWWQDLMIKGNNYDKLQLGRCVVQYHTNGDIGVTGFFDAGTGKANGRDLSEALQWTQLMMTADIR